MDRGQNLDLALAVESDHLKDRTPYIALRFSHGIGLGLRHCVTHTQLHTNHSVLFPDRSRSATQSARLSWVDRCKLERQSLSSHMERSTPMVISVASEPTQSWEEILYRSNKVW